MGICIDQARESCATLLLEVAATLEEPENSRKLALLEHGLQLLQEQVLELSQAAKQIARGAEDAPPEIGPPPKLLLAWAAYGNGLENFSVRDTFKQLQA